MKKLSLILVLALVITALTAMLVMNTSAETTPAPDADAPESIKVIDYAKEHPEFNLYTFESDEAALSGTVDVTGDGLPDKAVGRFTKAGGNGYAINWAAVGGNAADCGANVFYLIGDISLDGEAQRIKFDVANRTLIIDGTLGTLRTEGENAGKNFSITTNNRAIHYDGTAGKTGKLILKNITMVANSGSGIIQANNGLTVVLESGANLTTNGTYGIILGATAKLEVRDGAVLTATKAMTEGANQAELSQCIRLNQPGAEVEILGGTVTSSNSSAIFVKEKGKVTINGGSITGYYGVYANVADTTIDLNGGTVNGSKRGMVLAKTGIVLNVDGTGHVTGEQALEMYGVTVNVKGGKVSGLIPFNPNAAGNVLNITGGTIEKTGSANQGVIRGNSHGITVNVSGNPTIKCGGAPFWFGYYSGAKADITISGGNFTSSSELFKITDIENDTTKGVNKTAILNLTINGGTFESKSYGIWIRNEGTEETHSTITINGGKVTATRPVQIDGKHNVVNIGGTAELVGSEGAYSVTLKGTNNILNITGGTISNKEGVSQSYGTIMLEDGGGHTLNISGGTINALSNAIYVLKSSTVNISGNAVIGGPNTHSAIWCNEAANITISGGTLEGYATGSEIKEGESKKYDGTAVIRARGTLTISGGIVKGPRPVQIWSGYKCDITMTGGTIESTSNYAIDVKTNGNKIAINGGTLKVAGGSFGAIMLEGTGNTVDFSGTAKIEAVNAGIWDHVGSNTVNVKGGTIETSKYGVYPGVGTILNITGGTINSQYGVAIQKNDVILNVSGDAKINASACAIIVNVGDNSKVTIDGGTFVSSGNTIDISNADGAKDVVENVVVTINGGNFTSENGYVVRSEAAKGNNGGDKEVAANTKVTINGGTFTAKNAAKEAVLQGASAAKTFEIYGGTFNSWNKTATLKDNVLGTAEQTGHGNIKVYGVVWTQADTFNIYGGEFNLYKDDGKTLATESSCVIAFAGGTGVNVYGGAYSGGEYLVFKYPHKVSYDTIIADSSKCYKMPEDGTANINITTTKGASVRVDADLAKSGIRFEGTIGEDVFDFITKYVAKATDTSKAYAGIAIVPADYLGENGTNGVFTFDALAAKNLTAATTKATKGLVDNKNGTYTLRLSLVNIRESNYDRNFVAIAYVAYEKADGTLDVIYAPTTSGERSIEFVAKSALADVKPNETVAPNGRVYNTPVTEKFDLDQDKFVAAEAGMASKYNLAQIDLLKAYITVKE